MIKICHLLSIASKKARVEKLQKDLEKHREGREKKYKEKNPNRNNKKRFMSNVTHRSKTDPDARIAKRSSKPRMLCYSNTMSVDTLNNMITNICADYSSKKDAQLLIKSVNQTTAKLKDLGIEVQQVLADAGYSSGENYKILEQDDIEAFIPMHGICKTHRPRFKYEGRRDEFICKNGQVLKPTYKKVGKGRSVLMYRSKKKLCDKCPFREGCVTKKGIKKYHLYLTKWNTREC